ncbi:MAG: porin [Pseudomonadota bacterium]|jgi:cell division protein FtsB|nr:hypothetical protein [Alphaproteobacteria bacterium]
MSKSTILLLMAGISLAPLAAAESTSANQVAALQKQIEALQKQLEVLAKQVKEQGSEVKEIKTESKHAKARKATPGMPVVQEQADDGLVFDKGYMRVPGTKAAVKVGGMVKLDMIRDTKANTSEQTSVGRLPYALQMRNPSTPSIKNSWKEHFMVHAKQTKIRLDTVVKNTSGTDVKGFIEGDFFGSTHWGDVVPGGTTGNTTNSSTTYTFRLRHAVLSYGGLEAGHTNTTFHLDEAILPSVDLNGISGGYGRHALIRYTHKLGNFSITAAAENSRGDYVSYAKTPTNATTAQYTYNTQDSTGNLSKQTRPDLIMRVKYNFDSGSAVGVSVVNRDLRIKNNAVVGGNTAATTVDGRTYKADAWGANVAAKIMTTGGSFFTGGVSTGKGIGWYILEMNGRSALFDPAASTEGQRYRAIGMNMFWAGYSHVWTPQWQTSIGVAQIRLNTQAKSNDINRPIKQWFEPGIDKKFNKFLINTIYRPEDNLELGLEYFVLQRQSTLKYKGLGQRLQFGASYKF